MTLRWDVGRRQQSVGCARAHAGWSIAQFPPAASPNHHCCHVGEHRSGAEPWVLQPQLCAVGLCVVLAQPWGCWVLTQPYPHVGGAQIWQEGAERHSKSHGWAQSTIRIRNRNRNRSRSRSRACLAAAVWTSTEGGRSVQAFPIQKPLCFKK